MSHSPFHSTTACMRQAYDYWQDQPGNYSSGNPTGTLLRVLPFKGCSHSTDNLHYESGQPRKTHETFDCFILVSFRQTSGTAKSTECRGDTSGKNDSESKPLFLTKGHEIQHPSVLSLSTSRQLDYFPVGAARPMIHP